jgi:hypothetical protein
MGMVIQIFNTLPSIGFLSRLLQPGDALLRDDEKHTLV